METLFPCDDWAAEPVMAYKVAPLDPDTMYHHQAMEQPDQAEFIMGMQKEMDHQTEDGNFSIVHQNKIPKGETIFPGVWQM